MTLQRAVIDAKGVMTMVDLTPEEEAATLAEWAANEAAAISENPLSLVQLAAAKLVVDQFEVTGVERSQGIAGAFMLDIDYLYVMFETEQPDTDYIILPSEEGFTKYTDHVEIQRPGLSVVNFIIQRVQ